MQSFRSLVNDYAAYHAQATNNEAKHECRVILLVPNMLAEAVSAANFVRWTCTACAADCIACKFQRHKRLSSSHTSSFDNIGNRNPNVHIQFVGVPLCQITRSSNWRMAETTVYRTSLTPETSPMTIAGHAACAFTCTCFLIRMSSVNFCGQLFIIHLSV